MTVEEMFDAARRSHEDSLRQEGAREAWLTVCAMLDAVGGELAVPRASLVAVSDGDPFLERIDDLDTVTFRLRLKEKAR